MNRTGLFAGLLGSAFVVMALANTTNGPRGQTGKSQTDGDSSPRKVLSGRLSDGSKVEVSVDVAPSPEEDFYVGAIRWGSEEAHYGAKRLVRRVRVSIDSKEIGIPLSAYSDLSNPLSPRLAIKGRRFSLVLEGGDGIYGYKAVLHFSGGKLVKRTVSSLMSPDGGEESRYLYSSEVYE